MLALGVSCALSAAAQGREGDRVGLASVAEDTSPERGIAQGPDVTVFSFDDGLSHYGAVGSIHAYAIGTESCNQGDADLNWCDEPNGNGCAPGATSSDHPVIAQNVYRVKDGRFEHIGMSWLKHGFVALNLSAAGCGDGSCDPPPFGGDQLGPGCTDPYFSDLNGSRPLGMRSEVVASTGAFPFPYTEIPHNDNADQRVQIQEADLDPDLNPGARYFAEAQYVAPDDAEAENGLNNASHQEVSVQADFDLQEFGPMFREQSAIHAWQLVDPAVELANADIPGSVPLERFEAGRRVTQSGDGSSWHYEIAVRNTNSDRSGRGLLVQFPQAVTITGAGTHDIPHHSGEPYSTADWTTVIDADSIRWETESFLQNPNANALRWATTFSFWFDATAPPDEVTWRLELFKPGSPTTVDIPFPGSGAVVFEDDFESGDTSAWDVTTN